MSKRLKIYDRDEWRCCSCGITDNHTLQHRVNKGMGGDKTKDKVKDNPSNLVTMCNQCNTALEFDVDFRRTGISMGWKVLQGRDPSQIPCWFSWAMEWRLLDNNFGYLVVDKGEF